MQARRTLPPLLVAVAAAALAACGSGGSGAPGVASAAMATAVAPADPGPLVAPPSLVGYRPREDVLADLDTTRAVTASADGVREDAESSRLLRDAYGGDDALVTTYAGSTLESFFRLLLVRAPSPLPWEEGVDAARLGLAVSPHEVRTIGRVACELRNDPTPAGQTPAQGTAHVVACTRTARDLTVTIDGPSGDLGTQPSVVAALVEIAFSAVGGSAAEAGLAGDDAPVTLPEALGEVAAPAGSLGASDLAVAERTAPLVAAAYGGAPAAVRAYWAATPDDPGFARILVAAVRAPSPVLWTPYVDRARIGLARAPREIVMVGSTACVVAYDPTRPDEEPDAEATHVVACRRSSGPLTVEARLGGAGDAAPLAQDPARLAAVVEAAWLAAGGV